MNVITVYGIVTDNICKGEVVLYKKHMQGLCYITDITCINKPGWENKTRYLDINDRDDKNIARARSPLPEITEMVVSKK